MDEEKRKQDQDVQEADEESFPASDPPAYTMGVEKAQDAEQKPPMKAGPPHARPTGSGERPGQGMGGRTGTPNPPA